MKLKKYRVSIVFLFLITISCQIEQQPTAQIINENYLDCFAENTLDADSSKTSCEASAALFVDGQIFLASDKPIPNMSSVFSYRFNQFLDSNTIRHYDNYELKSAIKYEDFSILPDNKTILLSTGFDRIKKDTNSWDRYNCVLYWDKNKPENVQVLAKVDNKGVVSSVRLRPYFQKTLTNSKFPDGTPYFKIEGICAIPGNKLLFGVREKGASYTDFEYVVEIISVSYFFDKGEMILKNDFELVYKMNVADANIKEPCALSSLEYDVENERLYALTTFEIDDSNNGVGAYLWYISLDDFHKKKQLSLLKTKQGETIKFSHKAEGLAIVDSKTLFIVHDDDKRETLISNKSKQTKKPHQAVYSIVKLD
jgi:hypothetical protein